MPCAAPSRDNLNVQGPCAKKAVTSVAGVNVSAENLCVFHWTAKHGQLDLKAPVVIEP